MTERHRGVILDREPERIKGRGGDKEKADDGKFSAEFLLLS
jgi:hypothetical protein